MTRSMILGRLGVNGGRPALTTRSVADTPSVLPYRRGDAEFLEFSQGHGAAT